MQPCVMVTGKSVPPLYHKNENNIPEYVLPGNEELINMELDKSVVSVQVSLPSSEAVSITQVILGQWDDESDASVRIPNKLGENGYAQIVGFDSPRKSKLYPSQSIINIFFKWDKKITFPSLDKDND